MEVVFLVLGVILASCLGLPQSPSMTQYLDFEPEQIDSNEDGQAAGSKSTNCSCGWTNKARIVGGKETLKNEFPLIAGITLKGSREIFCGGSIITERHVLTAAHCPDGFPNSPFSVVLGEHDQTEETESSGAEIIDVSEAIIHENYERDTYFNDIALLVLEKKIKFNQLTGPVCLPSGRTSLNHEYVKAIGWGRLYTDGPTSQVLLKVNLRIIPIQTCADNYIRDINTENPHQICTFLRSAKNKQGYDTCQGDSGGPIIWLDPATNRYTLAALVSYGKKCGKKSPAVNTDVSYFLNWIQNKIAATDNSVSTCSKI